MIAKAARSKTEIDAPEPLGSGRWRYQVHGTVFDVPDLYTIERACGYGAFGFVVAAVNQKTKEAVAIKKCHNVFHDLEDGKRILREIKLLTFLKHENILHITDILAPSSTSFDEVYFVTALMDTDLNNLIRSKQRLTDDHIAYFVYQILRGLKYIHAANVLHRDLKPANLLVNVNCDLMIADFGLARVFDPAHPNPEMTEYVVTRWYRAPELLLMLSDYTGAIDVWSCGCVFAELYTRKPLFPGADYLGQLNTICEAVGVPDDLTGLTRESRNYLTTLPPKPQPPLSDLVPNLTNPDGVGLLRSMLEFNPRKRPSAATLLNHSFFSRLHDANDEPVPPEPFSWAQDVQDYGTAAEVRAAFIDEIRKFHPEMPPLVPAA